MFGSRLTEESLTKDVSPTPSDKMGRYATQIHQNLLDCDPEHEDDSPFFRLFQKLASIYGINGLTTLSHENLRTLCHNLKRNTNVISFYSILSLKKLKFFLKHL